VSRGRRDPRGTPAARGARGRHRQLPVLDAAHADQCLRDVPDHRHRAAQHEHFEAEMGVEVDVQRREDRRVVLVLDAGQRVPSSCTCGRRPGSASRSSRRCPSHSARRGGCGSDRGSPPSDWRTPPLEERVEALEQRAGDRDAEPDELRHLRPPTPEPAAVGDERLHGARPYALPFSIAVSTVRRR